MNDTYKDIVPKKNCTYWIEQQNAFEKAKHFAAA